MPRFSGQYRHTQSQHCRLALSWHTKQHHTKLRMMPLILLGLKPGITLGSHATFLNKAFSKDKNSSDDLKAKHSGYLSLVHRDGWNSD